MSSSNSRSVGNSVMAGYIAGVSGTVIGHPIDSIKVWKQTGKGGTSSGNKASYASGPSFQKSYRARYGGKATVRQCSSVAHPLPLIINQQSVLRQVVALYSGITGPLVTVGVIQSINFAIYDSTRRYLHYRQTGSTQGYLQEDSLTHGVALAGATVGLTSSLLTNPIYHIKVKQQTTQLPWPKAWRLALGRRGTFVSSVRHLYTGLGPHALSEVVARTVYFGTYEGLKRHWQEESSGDLSLASRMMAAATAGMACWSVIYPLDSIRNHLYAAKQPKAWSSAVQHIWQRGGVAGFYRGLGITLLRAGPVHAFVLPIYDICLSKLSQL